MKKNLYYRTVLKRSNVIKEIILSFFLSIASFPRLILEVFIRKKMGERYFTLASAITVGVVLFIIPHLLPTARFNKFSETLKENWLWYVFVVLYFIFSFLRYKEVKRLAHEFDMDRYSLSSGEILPHFYKLKFKGKFFTPRQIDIFIEPLPFFILGLLLILIGQVLLGILLFFCAIVYSLSYAGAYMQGDHFVMDIIDEMICNEDLSASFVKDEPSVRGFKFYGKKPSSEELREQVVESMFEDDFANFPEAE